MRAVEFLGDLADGGFETMDHATDTVVGPDLSFGMPQERIGQNGKRTGGKDRRRYRCAGLPRGLGFVPSMLARQREKMERSYSFARVRRRRA
jgi:hypothetical protein